MVPAKSPIRATSATTPEPIDTVADPINPDELDKLLPKWASGQLTLRVPPLFRSLAVDVTPEASEHDPGAETWVDVVVRDCTITNCYNHGSTPGALDAALELCK